MTMDFKVSHIIETYKNLSSVPSPTSAHILPGCKENNFLIHTTWNSRDLIKSESTNFFRQYVVKHENGKFDVLSCGMAYDTSSICFEAFSKNGRKRAILRKKGKSSDDFHFLEIWNVSHKESTFDMQNRKEHGRIFDNTYFGCLQWSSNEKYLLYIAEMKQPKSESHLKDTSFHDFNDKLNEEVVKGEEFIYREDWGEALAGIHHGVLCIIEVETGLVEVLFERKGMSVGQAIWGPDDENIIFVGWKESPRRLGLQYCINRKSAIYSLNVESKQIECISENGNISVRSPSISPDKSVLIYLENEAGGPHSMCSKIIKYDMKAKERSTLVDIVKHAPDKSFPGIYINSLPSRCWAKDEKYLIVSSSWRSRKVILCIDIENSNVQKIALDDKYGCCDVLDVQDNIIIIAVSSPNLEPFLVAGSLQKDHKVSLTWTVLDTDAPVKLLGINWTITALKPSLLNEKYPHLDFDIIEISPEEPKDKVPAIIWPHGGPHSVFLADFNLFAACFAKLGYIVCLINYRGSIGFGEDSIRSLLGNIGTQDVHDVQFAAEYLKKKNNLDIGDMILFGGSHGGFLVAHLSGQYPDFYKVCICRNPVIDISVMAAISDIPDWPWVETGHGDEYNFSSFTTPEILESMWNKSPIKYVKNVSIPTLLLIGKKDLRVPPSQGLMYYNILKARNVPVNLYYYDDNHALAKTGIEGDVFMQAMLWIKKHLSPS